MSWPNKEEIVRLIASRVACELNDGDYVNLGIGIPTMVVDYLPPTVFVTVQSENGVLGIAPLSNGVADPNLVNAGGKVISINSGGSYFDTAQSFAMIRGGHIDLTVLGALEVDIFGNIANWVVPGRLLPGMGGAMDLCVGAKKVIASLQHVDKNGESKILHRCTLPLTAKSVVDLIVTEMAVFKVHKGSSGLPLTLLEYASWTSVDEVRANTGAPFDLAKDLKVFV